MYMSVRRYTTSGPTNVIARIVTQGFVPIISDAPGFIAFYVVDGGDGSLASVNGSLLSAGIAIQRVTVPELVKQLLQRGRWGQIAPRPPVTFQQRPRFQPCAYPS